jgi:hypothetical protein
LKRYRNRDTPHVEVRSLDAAGVAFMLDQCHNIEPKIPAQIRSVMNVQAAVAKALLVDSGAPRRAARRGRTGVERGADGRLQHRRPPNACRDAVTGNLRTQDDSTERRS